MSNVPSAEESFFIEVLGGLWGLLPVAWKYIGAGNEQFTVFGDSTHHIRKGTAHGSHAIVVRRVHREHWRCFGETIAFKDADANAGVPVGGVETEGGAPGD